MFINIYAAPYLVNGDASGMDEHELEQIDEALIEYRDMILTDAEPIWARCDITGLWSYCHTYTESHTL